MNTSRTVSLLKQIEEDTNIINTNTGTTSVQSSMNGTKLDTINTTLTGIDTVIDTISSDVSAIKTDVDTLAKKKIIFNAKLSDGSNNHLTRSDYSGGNAINFSWQNDKGTQVYIYKYRFTYPEVSGEPGQGNLYHSTAWESKIGALNSGETDYEAPYITVNNNKDYFYAGHNNRTKQQWITTTNYVFQNDFNEAPIEIGISRKFGHYINGNIDTGNYGAPPLGIIDGYYYSS